MNKNMFISKMKLFGDTQAKLAKAVGLSTNRLNAKINQTGGAEFNISQMEIIKNRYNLSAEEIVDIFFTAKVSYQETNGS